MPSSKVRVSRSTACRLRRAVALRRRPPARRRPGLRRHSRSPDPERGRPPARLGSPQRLPRRRSGRHRARTKCRGPRAGADPRLPTAARPPALRSGRAGAGAALRRRRGYRSGLEPQASSTATHESAAHTEVNKGRSFEMIDQLKEAPADGSSSRKSPAPWNSHSRCPQLERALFGRRSIPSGNAAAPAAIDLTPSAWHRSPFRTLRFLAADGAA